MNTTTTERPDITDHMVDMYLQTVGNVCWAQEQGEKILQTMLEQRRVTREEGKRLAEKMAEHVRANQEEMQRFVQSAVQMSLAAFRIPTTGQVDELTKKVDELTRKVEALSKK